MHVYNVCTLSQLLAICTKVVRLQVSVPTGPFIYACVGGNVSLGATLALLLQTSDGDAPRSVLQTKPVRKTRTFDLVSTSVSSLCCR